MEIHLSSYFIGTNFADMACLPYQRLHRVVHRAHQGHSRGIQSRVRKAGFLPGILRIRVLGRYLLRDKQSSDEARDHQEYLSATHHRFSTAANGQGIECRYVFCRGQDWWTVSIYIPKRGRRYAKIMVPIKLHRQSWRKSGLAASVPVFTHS